jgi:hypothetical protein
MYYTPMTPFIIARQRLRFVRYSSAWGQSIIEFTSHWSLIETALFVNVFVVNSICSSAEMY